MIDLRRTSYLPPDGWLVLCTMLLLALSVLMVFSSTAVVSQELYGDPARMVKQHVIHVIAGALALLLCARLQTDVLYRVAPLLLVLSLILLLLTLIPGVGQLAGGARRWLGAGPLRFQPGEVTKLAAIVYFASYIARHRERMTDLGAGIIRPFVVLAMLSGLLLAEPDFGSTVVILAVVFAQLFMAARITHLLGIGVIAAGGLAVLVVTSPYRFRRFVAFLNPFHDPSSSGYQLIQSLIAVGSGGISGEGLGAGKQKLFYLPAAHTDFIFAVVAEELGTFGALFAVLIFMLILYRGIAIARRLQDEPFLLSLAVGCTSLIVLPAILNMGVVLGLLPTKGMVLPLVAYGGTAMIVHGAAMGILIRLSTIEAIR